MNIRSSRPRFSARKPSDVAKAMAPNKSASGGRSGEQDSGQVSQMPNGSNTSTNEKPTDYSSHGVTDNDIFLLPGSDFQLLGLLTAIAALVRLFRIYQPSSVVFDEVQ